MKKLIAVLFFTLILDPNIVLAETECPQLNEFSYDSRVGSRLLGVSTLGEHKELLKAGYTNIATGTVFLISPSCALTAGHGAIADIFGGSDEDYSKLIYKGTIPSAFYPKKNILVTFNHHYYDGIIYRNQGGAANYKNPNLVDVYEVDISKSVTMHGHPHTRISRA